MSVCVAVAPVGGGDGFVDLAVAIVVDLVADLGVARVRQRGLVVAVGVVEDVALGLCTGDDLVAAVAEPVCVCVGVPGLVQALVCFVIAVVVDAVTDLCVSGEEVGVGVVAVVAVGDVAFGREAAVDLRARIAESVAVGVAVELVATALVDDPVAVVVDAVTDLDLCGRDVCARVVAVPGDGDEARRRGAGGLGGVRVAVGVAVAVGVQVVRTPSSTSPSQSLSTV